MELITNVVSSRKDCQLPSGQVDALLLFLSGFRKVCPETPMVPTIEEGDGQWSSSLDTPVKFLGGFRRMKGHGDNDFAMFIYPA